MRTKRLFLVATVIVFATAAGGCGGDDNGGEGQAATATATATATTAATATQTPTAQAATGHALTVRMSEYAFDPKNAGAKAGKVTITAPNDGNTAHELVLLKTDADPASLPKTGGKVDESTSVGEISDVTPGSTKKATFKLAPGRYAMVCALPGHYESGMYGSLTVK